MKILYKIFLAVSLISVSQLSLIAQTINPITQAALDAYDSLLAKDPNDVITRFHRANQLYQINQYERALADINKGLASVNAKDKSMIRDLNVLAANTYVQLEDYDNALIHVNQALNAIPGDIPALYLAGNICLHQNDADGAIKSFAAMQRKEPRSQEALIGLAHAYILKGNQYDAKNVMDEAKRLAPNDALTYTRLGDLSLLMRQPQDAAKNYLDAFLLAEGSGRERPMMALVEMAQNNWDVVDNTLDNAIEQTQNTASLLFLRANIALNKKKYPEAYTYYRQLLSNTSEQDASLLSNVALSALRAGLYKEAILYADKALSLKTSYIPALIICSQAAAATSSLPDALAFAEQAVKVSPNSPGALMQQAKVLVEQKQFNDAVEILNKLIAQNPSDLEAMMLRGYLVSHGLASQTSVNNDYKRVANSEATNTEETVLKAIAQNLIGLTLDAQSTISPVINNAENDSEAAYFAAVYCANTGNNAVAEEYLNKAISNGFSDKYLLEKERTPLLSIGMIR